MKDGIHGEDIKIEELSAMRILKELQEKSLRENDGKVHIREIKNGHIGRMIEKF